MIKVYTTSKNVNTLVKYLPDDLKKLYLKFNLDSTPSKADSWSEDIERKGYMTHITNWKLEDEFYLFAWRIMFNYSRSLGSALSVFLEGLKNGIILGRKCSKCGRILVPPRIFCEWCFRDTDEWVEVPDTGIVSTFSIAHIPADPKVRLKKPIIAAVIWLDGTHLHRPSSTTERHWAGFLHILDETRPEDVKIGMHVKAVWEPPERRKGSILDIKYFKPI